MNKEDMNKVENFLKELTELTSKYGIEIRGCGCCGSPWITDGKEILLDHLTYEDGKYSIKNFE